MGMRFGAAFWAQRTTWPDLRDAVCHAEAAGVDSLWVDDHLLCDEGDWTDPKLEGWTTLAAVATVTSRPTVGLLVAAHTFRNLGLTAKLATTLDHLSGGRAVLGLGAGWFEREHEAFGIDFGGGFGERLDRLAEAVPLLRRLLDGERIERFEGRFHELRDAVVAPRPIQPHLPILVGGSGPTKTLPLIARSADLWNARGEPATLAAADARLREACEAIGRDETTIERTFYINACIRGTRAAAFDAWQATVATHRPIGGEDRPELVGTVEDVAARLREYAAVGFRHAILVFRSPWDPATLDALPRLRELVGDA